MTQKRERFLHSGALKVLPNEENAPGLAVQPQEALKPTVIGGYTYCLLPVRGVKLRHRRR